VGGEFPAAGEGGFPRPGEGGFPRPSALYGMGAPSEVTATRSSARPAAARCGKQPRTDGSSHRIVELVGGKRVAVASVAPPDVRISAIAELQRARVSRAQLLASGVSDSTIARRLRRGRLERLHVGVYALPHTSDLPLAAETAALLACGDGAVLSHHTAATLWGLRPGVARPVHVTIPGDRGFPAPTGVKLHRSRTIGSADICIHDGLPVTSPARTLLDAAATLPDRDVERLLDEGLFVRRVLAIADVNEILSRAGNHPGRARLARVAATHSCSTRTDSPPEETLLALIRAAGLPDPQVQVYLLGYRLDFFWPELKLAVEVDAYGTHGSPARFEADRRRDARLLAEKGIVVLRLTRGTIEHRPFEALGLLARAIGQREAERRAV
jgi:very-short-patch-repair endonuclease